MSQLSTCSDVKFLMKSQWIYDFDQEIVILGHENEMGH